MVTVNESMVYSRSSTLLILFRRWPWWWRLWRWYVSTRFKIMNVADSYIGGYGGGDRQGGGGGGYGGS